MDQHFIFRDFLLEFSNETLKAMLRDDCPKMSKMVGFAFENGIKAILEMRGDSITTKIEAYSQVLGGTIA